MKNQLEMVNTEIRKDGDSSKNLVEFTNEIVEEIYESLPSSEKYITDEAGNVMKLDPIGVVRSNLESMQRKLDPAWYAYGTEAPSAVSKVKIAESIKWKEAKDFYFNSKYDSEYNKKKTNEEKLRYKQEKTKKILGIDKPGIDINEIVQKFNKLDVNQWYVNLHEEILTNIRNEIEQDIDSEFTVAIATYITEDGLIKHIIATNGKTDGTSKDWKDIGDKIRKKYKSDDIIIAYSPEGKRLLETPSFTSTLPRDNHAEVKIFEKLMRDENVDSKSKIFISTNRYMCVTCRMASEQYMIYNDNNGKYTTVEFYDGAGLIDINNKDKFPSTNNWNEEKFKDIYSEFFRKHRIRNYEIKLNELWERYKSDIYHSNPDNYIGEK